jgi:branched-subunit amino acid ABC-type transport system permease component
MKAPLKFGLIYAGVSIGISLLMFGLGLDKNDTVMKVINFASMAVAGTIIYFGIRERRDLEGNGYINFGKAFSTGFTITLIGDLFTAVYSYLYFTVLNPGMMTYIQMKQEEEMIKRGMSDSDVEAMAGTMAKWSTPEIYTGFAFLGILVVGLILSLILAAILKKENPAEEMV